MAHTPAPPPDDPRFWRLALARAHPDSGGDHALFIWLGAVRDHVLGHLSGETWSRRRDFSDDSTVERIPYDPDLGSNDTEFAALTSRALRIGQDVEAPFNRVLGLLIDCPAHDHGRAVAKQERGASFKQLAYVAHLAGFSHEDRSHWYVICKSIPLSEAHAAHLITRLKQHKEEAA